MPSKPHLVRSHPPLPAALPLFATWSMSWMWLKLRAICLIVYFGNHRAR